MSLMVSFLVTVRIFPPHGFCCPPSSFVALFPAKQSGPSVRNISTGLFHVMTKVVFDAGMSLAHMAMSRRCANGLFI